MSISLEKALELTLKCAAPLEAERLPLLRARGRVLAESVSALYDQPPFPRSPLDGYALRSADIADASKENPAILRVSMKLYAGDAPKETLTPGCAARVMTGAQLPGGADCVVRQEDSDEGEEMVKIYKSIPRNGNYVFAGEDFKKDETLLFPGIILGPAELSIAASAGVSELLVRRRPRVAVIATGDELALPGAPLPPGKIYNSNLTYMCARLEELGAELVFAESAGDELSAIREAVERGARLADVVVTTGGVSVGQKDLLPAVMEALDAEVFYHGVAIKPGMPAMCSRLKSSVVFSLSGNPFAAAVTLELLTKPLLFALGAPEAKTVRFEAKMATGFPKGSPVRRYVRGKYQNGVVEFPDGHSNGQMRSLCGCNCLADVPAGSEPLAAGDKIEVIML